jgi:hypothetical protein
VAGEQSQVLTVTLLEQGVGGGTGDTFSFYDNDKPPVTPHALDDEFPGTSLNVKWAWRNQGGATAAVRNGRLVLTAPANSGNQLRIIEQTAPGGNYRLRSKTRMGSVFQNNVMHGLAVQRSGKVITFSLDVLATAVQLSVNKWTAVGTFSSTPNSCPAEMVQGGDLYLEVEYDGTNLYFRYSPDAENWGQLFSESAATFLGGAPETIGLMANANSVNAAAVHVCEWFRVRTTAGAEGGVRNIGATPAGNSWARSFLMAG